ncbi:UDP-N-acetylglucosamine 2-epimerase (hydrolyzing) [Pseudomaricurvus alcaniphilus]|uniref:UDP-N-acetylglucosamine 2-epimerase n=1 Tax=Pseudomaricurvus alcaniphilus TaxID=1166482 RepID=UPI00140E07D6|nr:UDP-N-acetylglucosamine 2-epimerase [Pseudomaricurvus alcaniphilus]NHN39442.1 UDP-N-acetylglucosamine 2-epimerase (hydrolyzing) [Pseudomaricurvus alcaniphilus]
MRKIAVVTGTRAEYGLLSRLLRLIEADPDCELQLIVTGMHLSEKFGNTLQAIEADGFGIAARVPIPVEDDTPHGVCVAMAQACAGISAAFDRLAPDILVLLGDRFEALAAAQAALIHRLPVAHLHGGEVTEGVVDEALRHAITKMSHLHFTATETYRSRVIQLGEQPARVHCVGAVGVELIHHLKLLTATELQQALDFRFKAQNVLLTYHPETLSEGQALADIQQLLVALSQLPELGVILTYPNADTESAGIIQALQDFQRANSDRVLLVKSLGQLRYLSAVRHVDAVLGNSSSGLIEVPSLGTPTVNIGARQKGRIEPGSVISCGHETADIVAAITRARSAEFQQHCRTIVNPYDGGAASEKILAIIKAIELSSLTVKTFYDLPRNGDSQHGSGAE